MATFELGALKEWERVFAGEPVTLDYPAAMQRKLRIVMMSANFVEVYATESGSEPVLIGAGLGRLLMRFSARGAVVLQFRAEEDCGMYLRTVRMPQVIPDHGHTSFTTIEPRGVGPSSDMRRMMHMMELNQRRRDEQFQAELARLGSKYEADRRAALAERKKKPEAEVASEVPE